MASGSPSSSSSASSIPFGDSDGLSLDLQPAPLRLPQRKIDTNLDGSNSVDLEQMSTEKDDPFTSSVPRDRPCPPPQPVVTKTLSQPRHPAPKLGSLVSKFEILDAVNNAEASSLAKPKPSWIPRTQKTLGRQGKQTTASQKITPADGQGTVRDSSSVSPKQVASPPPINTSSKNPTCATIKTATRKDDADNLFRADERAKGKSSANETGRPLGHQAFHTRQLKHDNLADRRRVFEHTSTYFPFVKPKNSTLNRPESHKSMPDMANSTQKHVPTSNSARRDSPAKSKLQMASSACSLRTLQQASTVVDEQSHHVVEQSPTNKPEPTTLSRSPVRKKRPSVADLRKSFEQNPQLPKRVPQALTKSKVSSEVMPRLSNTLPRGSTSSVRTMTQNNSPVARAPPAVVGKASNAELKNKSSEQSLPTRNSIHTLRHVPKFSLPSNRFRQKDAHNLDGAISSENGDVIGCVNKLEQSGMADIPRVPTIRGSRSFPYTIPIHPFLSTSSINGFRSERAWERPVTETEVSPENGDKPSTGLAPNSKPTTRCPGRVTDLRRLFERTPHRDLSPSAFKSFWQNRARNKPKVETEKVPGIAEYNQDGSSTTLAAHISPSKRFSVPELTTEISVNDFSCAFPDTLGDTETIKLKAHFDIEPDTTSSKSPVKDRIQQFECIERDSLALSPVPFPRAKSYDTNMYSSYKGKENDVKQIRPRASWRPFRQRSVDLWRRFSNSFARPTNGGNSASCNEMQAGPSGDADIEDTWRSSLRRRLKYRRSDIVGQHLYRSSEVARSSTTSSHSRSSVDVDDEAAEKAKSQSPYLTHTPSPSHNLPMRRTFPSLARMSDSLGYTDDFDDFGFDGSILSKAIRRRGQSPTAKISQTSYPSSSDPSRGDPKTLTRIVSQQTTAERKRRRLEEKRLRQDQRNKKREEKSKAKGKEKETVDEYTTDDGKRAEDVPNKGKDKETEGKKRESSWSKKTASGFVVRQINDVKLRHPKPRRPGQVKKIVNMYKEKATSGIRIGKGSGVGSGSGTGAAAGSAGN